MKITRRRYSFGCVARISRKTGPDVWVFRYKDRNDIDVRTGEPKRKAPIIGTVEDLPTKADAIRAAEHLRLIANPDQPAARGVTFGALVDRYLIEELPQRFSTQHGYKSYLGNHIKPKWGEYPLTQVKPFGVELWIKSLSLAPKSKGHIRTVMQSLFECAMRWELIPIDRNPMSLVRIPDVSKRKRKPRVLTIPEIQMLAAAVDHEPTQTMIWIAVCLGLSCSEFSGLQWEDIDWEQGEVYIRRGVVSGRVDNTKNEYREAPLPMAPELAEILLSWKRQTKFSAGQDWVFANPYMAGEKPYNAWNLNTLRLQPAAKRLGLAGFTGWHSLRHTYSTLLRQLGTDLKVQQALMRHADIRTTMNTYTQAVSRDMREANRRLVSTVVPGMVQ